MKYQHTLRVTILYPVYTNRKRITRDEMRLLARRQNPVVWGYAISNDTFGVDLFATHVVPDQGRRLA